MPPWGFEALGAFSRLTGALLWVSALHCTVVVSLHPLLTYSMNFRLAPSTSQTTSFRVPFCSTQCFGILHHLLCEGLSLSSPVEASCLVEFAA